MIEHPTGPQLVEDDEDDDIDDTDDIICTLSGELETEDTVGYSVKDTPTVIPPPPPRPREDPPSPKGPDTSVLLDAFSRAYDQGMAAGMAASQEAGIGEGDTSLRETRPPRVEGYKTEESPTKVVLSEMGLKMNRKQRRYVKWGAILAVAGVVGYLVALNLDTSQERASLGDAFTLGGMV